MKILERLDERAATGVYEDPAIGPPAGPWVALEARACWLLINMTLDTTPEPFRRLLERSLGDRLLKREGGSR